MLPWTRPGQALLAACAVLASLVAGPIGAAAVITLPAAAHVLRSPERTFDALYVAAFCGSGLLVGR